MMRGSIRLENWASGLATYYSNFTLFFAEAVQITMLSTGAETTKYKRIEDTERASIRDYMQAAYDSYNKSYLCPFTLYLTVSFVSGLCIAFLVLKISVMQGLGSYESGFTTEIGTSLKPKLEKVRGMRSLTDPQVRYVQL
jgi:hypothetical protein